MHLHSAQQVAPYQNLMDLSALFEVHPRELSVQCVAKIRTMELSEV